MKFSLNSEEMFNIAEDCFEVVQIQTTVSRKIRTQGYLKLRVYEQTLQIRERLNLFAILRVYIHGNSVFTNPIEQNTIPTWRVVRYVLWTRWLNMVHLVDLRNILQSIYPTSPHICASSHSHEHAVWVRLCLWWNCASPPNPTLYQSRSCKMQK